MSNYLKTSSLYNTGFILSTETDTRIKQGLQPQTISSACAYQEPPKSSFPVVGHPVGYKFLYDMYPVTQSTWKYDEKGEIPDNCPCTRFLHSS